MGYNKNHTGIYDSKEGYDLVFSDYKKYRSWLDGFCKIDFFRFIDRNLKGINIVDLGAGDGRLWRYLSKLNYENYFVCDISNMILNKHPGDVKKYVFDLNLKFPLKSDYFDLATSFFVLEHISNLDNFFSESYRILKKGGKLIIGYFLQRREFIRKIKGESFKIKMYKHKIHDLKKIAEDSFFECYINPINEKGILIGYIIVCEKN